MRKLFEVQAWGSPVVIVSSSLVERFRLGCLEWVVSKFVEAPSAEACGPDGQSAVGGEGVIDEGGEDLLRVPNADLLSDGLVLIGDRGIGVERAWSGGLASRSGLALLGSRRRCFDGDLDIGF